MATQLHTLPVSFMTRTPYPLPSQRFMIPVSWNRYQLSQLVNKALELAQPIPFDFILKKTGQLLRESLKEWCKTSGVGMEETLEIEYVESLLPPTHVTGIPHEDWATDVSLGIQGHFVTSSYDGLLRIFDSSHAIVHTIDGHTAPVTSVIAFSPSASHSIYDGSSEVLIASASHDGTARITAYDVEGKRSRALASLHLHSSPVSSISTSSTGRCLLTTGWDNLIGVWDTQIPSSDEVAIDLVDDGSKSRKRRRVINSNGEDVSGGVGVKLKAPLVVLKSHTSRVMSACFCPTDEKRAFSGSLDSTIRSWDIEMGVCVHTQTAAEAPFISLAHLSSPDLLAAASTDRNVRIFDTRALTSSRSSSSFHKTPITLQHSSTPSVLMPSPINAHHIAGGGYDGVIRIWDVRCTKGDIASFRVGENADEERRGDGKILGMDWKNGIMGVGGEAGLDVWRVPEKV